MQNISTFSRFFIIQTLILLISGIVLLWVFPVGGNIDMRLIAPWIDQFGHFPYKDNWFTDTLAHRYVKNVLIAMYSVVFFTWLASFKFQTLGKYRYVYGYFFIVSMICTTSIGYMKAHAGHACPWDMTVATSTGFQWDFSATAGKCFPGGHASTGFALLTGYFVYRDSKPKSAYFFLVAGLILGFAMGWTQMMRGAHFLSHNLWTAWIIWCINLVIYAISHLSWFQKLRSKK